jgi:hypothetical protein
MPVDAKFKTLTCLPGALGQDPVLDEINRQVQASSFLEVMKSYEGELKGKLDNNAPAYQKLTKLFMAAITPDKVEGHHDGEAVGLRSGDEHVLLASYGNFLGYLWGELIGPVAPWVGKSFLPISAPQLADYTDGVEQGTQPTYFGINHFEKLEESAVNSLSYPLLTFWLHLNDAPPEQKDLYGYDKNGGLFIARRAPSVYAGTNRDVFQLNYRWHNLGNWPPFSMLIDELVQIAEGAYLGQLLFATKNLLGRYTSQVPASDYGFQHFGFFLLMDDTWAAETRRVFPHIKSGDASVHPPSKPQAPAVPAKFTTFTFADPVDGSCNDAVLAEVREDMKQHATILDLLKSYADNLLQNFDNTSPAFAKLHELFNRGLGIDEVHGYLRGALISFHTEGYYKLLNLNTLDLGWKLGRHFTPWTGKTFDPIALDRLKDITDGFEQAKIPTFWGTNTLSMKTAKQRFIGDLMKIAHVPHEVVPPDEAKANGYDWKSFYFIGHGGVSVNAENHGKKVFLFNYRWPKLKTFPPDNYCIDELVQLAEGLYLGQLIYSTELLKKFDPHEPTANYNYRLFGYFLLMDEEWQKRRLAIGLDPNDV